MTRRYVNWINLVFRPQGRADYVEIAGSDHMMIGGPYMPATLAAFDTWAAEKGLDSRAEKM